MGYGVVTEKGGALSCVEYGALLTSNVETPAQRLLILHRGLTELIAKHGPEAVAVEQLFFNRNVRTALAVGQARGVVLLAAAQANLPVFEYTPLQVKDAVVGYGRATKEQVQLMIRTLLHLSEIPRPDDAADALAIAVCHLHSARLGTMLSGRVSR